jgi:MFS transporter, DHA2 family, methylenomycin A resistance protein
LTSHRRLALTALTGAAAVAFLDLTAVSLALPDIQRDLGASSGAVQWVMTGYLVALAVAVAAGGRLADLLGARRAFLAGLGAFAASSALAGVAPELAWLVAARVAQGLAAALLVPAAQSLAVEAFGPDRLGAALGVVLGLSSLALIVGPLIGGALVEALGWRAVFFVNLPVVMAIALATLRAFGRSPADGGRDRLDLAGCLLLAASAGGLVLAASDPGGSWPAFLAAGAGAGFVLWRHERRAANPLLAPALLRDPDFAGSLAAVFLLQFAPIAVIVYGSIFLQDAVVLSPLEAGLAVLPATAAFLGSSLAGGRLADRRGARLPTVAGAALIAAALAWIALVAAERSYGILVPGLIGFGAGLGLCAAPINAALLAAAPAGTAGNAAGLIATARQLGSALAAAALGAAALLAERASLPANGAAVETALERHQSAGLERLGAAAGEVVRDAIAAGTAAAMWIAAALTAVAAAVALRYVPRHRREDDERAA